MKKLCKYCKISIVIILICCINIISLASLSASDGSAFVTKTEFYSYAADIDSRFATSEAGINSKIDSQVISYLDRNGMWNGDTQTIIQQPTTYWGSMPIGKYKWTMLDCFGNEGKYQTKANWDSHSSRSYEITSNNWQKYPVASNTYNTFWNAIKSHSQVTNNGYDLFPVQIRWFNTAYDVGYWALLIDGTKDSKLETPTKGFFAPKRLFKSNKNGLLMCNFSLRYLQGNFISLICPSDNTKSYKTETNKTPRVDAKDLGVTNIRSYDLGIAFVRGDEVDSSENLVNGAIMYRKSYCSSNIVADNQYSINWLGNRCGSSADGDANCFYKFPNMISLDEVVTFFVQKNKNYYIAQSPVLDCAGITIGALQSEYFYKSEYSPEVTVTNVCVY